MSDKIEDRSFEAAKKRFDSASFIDSVCMSYRHDFGLMSEEDMEALRFQCREWMRSIANNWQHFKEKDEYNDEWEKFANELG